MALITWNEDYSVKIEAMDKQHIILVDLINQLFDALKAGKAKDEMGKILQALIDYTVTHFKSEEAWMEKHGYADMVGHKQEHQKFVDKVVQFQADFNSGKATVSYDIMNFLKDWLVNHIQGTDKKYSSLN